MKTSIIGVMLVTGLSAAACGGGGGQPPGDDTPDATPGAPDADPEGWQVLAQGTWTIPAPSGGSDPYYCIYATIPRDIYIKALRPLIPNGTHHTVATYLDAGDTHPDGIVPCNVSTNGQNMFFGSGVGSPDFVFPTGIGLHFRAGDRILINLHLFNATDGELTGTSGTLFQEATAAEIQHEAEIILAGPTINLTVPTGTSTQGGTSPCHLSNAVSQPIEVFSLSQHMHRLGTHMRSVVTHSDSTTETLQDIDYAFESQTFQLTSPQIHLDPSDILTTYCTYDNTTGQPVGFGESSSDEMCFTDLFYYPAQGANFVCTF
jgi:hypothetical protein